MNNVNLKHVQQDIFNAEKIFGSDNVWWDKNFNWIMINNFKLPCSYNQEDTNFLVILSSGYGYGTKLEEFYLNKGLKIYQNGKWNNLPHYYHDNISKGHSYYDKNWQWLCIHPNWDKGDNLLTFLKQVELFLKYPFKESLI